MPSELPRSKEALVFAWGANASALPLFPAGGETDWRIRSTGPQDSFSVVAALRTAFRAKTHQRRSWSHRDGRMCTVGCQGKIRSTIATDLTTAGARSLDDHPDADAGIVDMPGN